MDIKTKERAASPRYTERPVTSAESAICAQRMVFSNREWQHHLLPGGAGLNELFFRIVARVAGAIRYTRGINSSALFTTRIPRPPPPKLALMISGNPISLAARLISAYGHNCFCVPSGKISVAVC